LIARIYVTYNLHAHKRASDESRVYLRESKAANIYNLEYESDEICKSGILN